MFKFFRSLLFPTAPTLPVDPPTVTKGPYKYGLCIGINKFYETSNNLRGCVNDANAGKALLQRRGFTVQSLLDSNATRAKILESLYSLQNKAQIGDEVFITLSSHGSHIDDENGDEIDQLDETWVTHDMKHIIDDELRSIIDGFKDGVKITVISDSCHSGTITRSLLSTVNSDQYIIPKYLPPNEDYIAVRSAGKVTKDINTETMKEVVLTGCSAAEFSYDARIGSKFRGVLSYYTFKILENNPDITYRELHEKLRRSLPSRDFPQSPQLEGKEENLNQKVFS